MLFYGKKRQLGIFCQFYIILVFKLKKKWKTLPLACHFWFWIGCIPWRGWGGQGTKHLVLYGEAQPLTCTFYIPSIYKWYPFHIPTSSLELCIPFNCCKSRILEIWVNCETRVNRELSSLYVVLYSNINKIFMFPF